jgi:hypothetical protein
MWWLEIAIMPPCALPGRGPGRRTIAGRPSRQLGPWGCRARCEPERRSLPARRRRPWELASLLCPRETVFRVRRRAAGRFDPAPEKIDVDHEKSLGRSLLRPLSRADFHGMIVAGHLEVTHASDRTGGAMPRDGDGSFPITGGESAAPRELLRFQQSADFQR